MANTLQLGYPQVPKSITNPDVKRQDALDVEGPMPFLRFIKIIDISFEPDSLQGYYNYYIKTWNNQNTAKPGDERDIITEQYRDFIKDITLNYTTFEEKEFLSKIDFTDPYDLDVVLGFYSKKLKEIALFYNNKRNDVKFSLTRTKLKGTNFGNEKTISELVLSYLKNKDDGKILYNYDQIKAKLEIEIEELYNTYPTHFNQTPNDQIYDNKDLDYGLNLFLRTNEEVIAEVFSGMSEELKSLKEVEQLYDNKRALTQKYMAFPMYYIQTGNTTSDLLSGKLFDNVSTTSNFLNRDYPTTASTEQLEYLETPRDRGFFRPQNTAIVLVDGLNHTFKINTDQLEPNSLYVFPDPSIAGTNGNVITFIVDDSYLKRNFSSGSATNQPYSTQYDTKYYGYVSKIEPAQQKYLDTVFESGYIKDAKRDIYGNLFGLFVNDGSFIETIQTTTVPAVTSVVFNGHTFFDLLYNEGFNYNYQTSDFTTYSDTRRSGLSTYTNGFSAFVPDLILHFGSFANNKTLKSHPMEYEIQENAYIMNGDNFYIDTVSSDLSAFELAASTDFYFSELTENGVNDNDPLQRALLDALYPSLTANLMTYGNSLTSFTIIESGDVGLDFPEQELTDPSYYYDPTVSVPTVLDTTTAPLLSGKLMVRDTYTKSVSTVLNALQYLPSLYSASIINQISSKVSRFEVAADILLMETDNWLIINQLKYDTGHFINPHSNTYQLQHNVGNFDKISNRVKHNFDIWFSKFVVTEPLSSNTFVIYPQIYQYNMKTLETKMIYPVSDVDTVYFTVSGGNTRYCSADSPILNYDSRTNTFVLALPLKDQNDELTIHVYPFYLNPNVTFDTHTVIKMSPYDYSNIFGSSSLTFYLSSGPYTIISEELIL